MLGVFCFVFYYLDVLSSLAFVYVVFICFNKISRRNRSGSNVVDSLQQEISHGYNINTKYWNRTLWRLSTILYRFILFLLIWRIIGGVWLIGILIWEVFAYFTIYCVTGEIVFFEALMGYVLQNTKFKNGSIVNTMKNGLCQSLRCYQLIALIVYGIGLFAVCIISFVSNNCCDSMDIPSLIAIVVVFCASYCTCVCYLCYADSDCRGGFIDYTITTTRCLFPLCRILLLFVYCILFNYYISMILILIDVVVIVYFSVKYGESFSFFENVSCGFLAFGSLSLVLNYDGDHTKFEDHNDFLLFVFHFVYSFVYFIFVVFFMFVNNSSNPIDMLFVNKYDDTIKYFINDGLVILMISFVGVSSILLPIWTYHLINKSNIINKAVSANRTFNALSESGDILGLLEFIQFGGIKFLRSSHGHTNGMNLKQYLVKAIESDNFQSNIFDSMNFLQQYQLMRYLFDECDGITITTNLQQQLIQKIGKNRKVTKEFMFKFDDNENGKKLLESFFEDCFDESNRNFNKHRFLQKIYTKTKLHGMCGYLSSQLNSLDEWSIPIDFTGFEAEEIMYTMSVIARSTKNSNSKSNCHVAGQYIALEKYFKIDWHNYCHKEQVEIAVHCYKTFGFKLSHKMQTFFIKSIDWNDIADTDIDIAELAIEITNKQPATLRHLKKDLLDCFCHSHRILLFNKIIRSVAMKLIYQPLIWFVENVSINQWHCCLNLSSLSFGLMIQVISKVKNMKGYDNWCDKIYINYDIINSQQQYEIVKQLWIKYYNISIKDGIGSAFKDETYFKMMFDWNNCTVKDEQKVDLHHASVLRPSESAKFFVNHFLIKQFYFHLENPYIFEWIPHPLSLNIKV